MKRVGAHVSISGGVSQAPLNAHKLAATAFALFTRNQRQWNAPPYPEKEVVAFHDNLAHCGYAPRHVLPHDSYLINLAHPEEENRQKSFRAFVDEMDRCRQLGLVLLNFHPGSPLDGDREAGITRVAECLNRALEQVAGVTAVIENTAGQGSSLGHRFEEIAQIIQGVEDKSRVGVCLDTCHTFVAGYDLRKEADYQRTMTLFDETIGLGYLRGMHLNDSKPDLGSRLDRHESLGKGKLGWEPFRLIMNDPRLDDIPLVLETVDETLWAEEIRLLYRLVEPS
ncbi:MAG: deoxyribonuclease IV [Magnetococcales bacterium]|nr:deoxyribonuclease IV [Magnetococcales bacterium]NGZ29447.1 deoxyribonuclease IV [Magnetococcales bacterium]